MIWMCRLIFALLIFFPLLAIASPACVAVTDQINADIQKYPNSLQNRSLAWKNLNWLQTQLGKVPAMRMANNEFQYEWHCDKPHPAYLAVITDENGNLLTVKVSYDTANGSGLFSADLRPKHIVTVNNPVSTAAPPPCKTIIDHISADITRYGQKVQQQNLPWMDLMWLQNTLGQAKQTTLKEFYFQWNGFGLLERKEINPSALSAASHSTPLSSTSQDAIRRFGNPNRVLTETLIKYSWECPTKFVSTLTVITDQNSTILEISGRACTDSQCTGFSVALNQSELEKRFRRQQQGSATNAALSMAGNGMN